MDIYNKKIGIWGFGVVGKAALRYLHAHGAIVHVLDIRTPNEAERQLLESCNAQFWLMQTADDLTNFLTHQEKVLVSPGVDIRKVESFTHKFIAELDLFGTCFKKPIIAVTGSVGKTTTTLLLSMLLTQKYPRLWTGGNIGTSVLDVLQNQDDFDAALIEVSSFQLERCTTFAPDLALWTNLFPNHLDRHGTQEGYFKAKFQIMAHQRADQKAIVPLEIYDMVSRLHPRCQLHAYTAEPEHNLLQNDNVPLFYVQDHHIVFKDKNSTKTIIGLDDLPHISFTQNWVLICSALKQLGIACKNLESHMHTEILPEHRLELVARYGGVDFYNDSKATTPAATLAAVQKLQGRPVVLILGGLSKGVNREPLIAQLANNVEKIYCFGKEREQLAAWCAQYNIVHESLPDLEAVCAHYRAHMKSNDQLLFSPAGSSFDQFADYQERGRRFKEYIVSH